MRNKAPRIDNRKVISANIGGGLVLMQFEDAGQPVFVEKKGKPYIYYGENNDYPNYLLYLFNNSSKHSAIINGKAQYVCGKGLAVLENEDKSPEVGLLNEWIKKANAKGETLDNVLEKLELDFELFNGAYVQAVWNRAGDLASVYHVDYTTVRSDKRNTKFFVSDEWVITKPDGTFRTNSNPKYSTFNAFNPRQRKGTQILYIKKYHPGMDTYTVPKYAGSNTWIEIDIQIAKYHLNNVKGGFFANKLINLFGGEPGEEGRKTIEKMFKDKFGGVSGQKYILNFVADPTKAATVEDLSISESDKIFDILNKTASQEIFTGHTVTSPMLFGIKTEGQLGGRTEMRDAYEIFQNNYVTPRQKWLTDILNMLAGYKGIKVPLTIQRAEPIGSEFSETVQVQNMSKDEIREKMGLPVEEKPVDKQSMDLINALNGLSPVVLGKVLENMSPDELRGLVGLSSSAAVGSTTFSAEDDLRDAKIFSNFGIDQKDIKIFRSRPVVFTGDEDEATHFANEISGLTDLQLQILNLLEADPLATQEVLSQTLKIDIDEINSAIDILSESELIKSKEVTKNGEKIVERKPVADARKIVSENLPKKRAIKIMYSYSGPQDNRNRPFCAEMMKLNRLYSRADIEKISSALGYSVWARRGGWYMDPNTGKARPYCRHTWKSNIVIDNE